MYLGKLTVNKETNIKILNSSFQNSCFCYINSILCNKHSNNKEFTILNNIQEYINNIFNVTYNIKSLYIQFFSHVYFSRISDTEVELKIDDYTKITNELTCSRFYRLVSYGNFELAKSSILDDALIFGIKSLKLIEGK